jgi:hypothetical protein
MSIPKLSYQYRGEIEWVRVFVSVMPLLSVLTFSAGYHSPISRRCRQNRLYSIDLLLVVLQPYNL